MVEGLGHSLTFIAFSFGSTIEGNRMKTASINKTIE